MQLRNFATAVRELMRDFHVKADPGFVAAVLKSAAALSLSNDLEIIAATGKDPQFSNEINRQANLTTKNLHW